MEPYQHFTEKEYQSIVADRLGADGTEVRTENGRADVVTSSCVWEVKRYIFRLRDAISAYSQAEEYRSHLGLNEVGVAAIFMSYECLEWLKDRGAKVMYEEVRSELDSDWDLSVTESQAKKKYLMRRFHEEPSLVELSHREIGRRTGVSAPFVKKVIDENWPEVEELKIANQLSQFSDHWIVTEVLRRYERLPEDLKAMLVV